MVAPAILSKLMTSSEMDDCLDTLHIEMGEAVSDMCANFDRELGKILKMYIYMKFVKLKEIYFTKF